VIRFQLFSDISRFMGRDSAYLKNVFEKLLESGAMKSMIIFSFVLILITVNQGRKKVLRYPLPMNLITGDGKCAFFD